jgi:hypothetical protein
MLRTPFGGLLLIALFSACASERAPRTAALPPPPGPAAAPGSLMPSVPPVFVANGGQWPAHVRFAMGGRGCRTWLEV